MKIPWNHKKMPSVLLFSHGAFRPGGAFLPPPGGQRCSNREMFRYTVSYIHIDIYWYTSYFQCPNNNSDTIDARTKWFGFLRLCQTRKVHFRVLGQFNKFNTALRSSSLWIRTRSEPNLGGRHLDLWVWPRTPPASTFQHNLQPLGAQSHDVPRFP